MIIDKELELSNAQAITTSDSSTIYINLGVAGRDIGMSEDLHVCVTVMETVTATGAATVVFTLQADVLTDFSTAVAVHATAAIAKATLVAGYRFFIKIPPGIVGQYLNMLYTVGTGPLTAGKFSAHVVSGIDKTKAYPNAI